MSNEYVYKTKNGQELTIPGVGTTVDGEISSPRRLRNVNLQLVQNPETAQPVQAATPAPEAAPAAVIGVAPQATAPQQVQQPPVASVASPTQPQPINQEQNQQ